MSHQQRDVCAAFAQGRDLNGHHIEAIEQIFAEGSFPNAVGQVLVGRGDEPDVNGDRAGSPDPLKFSFLQDAQQFDLHRGRTLADFIEEQCTAIGDLKTSGLHLHGLGKRASFMAKELAFQYALCRCRTIDFDEGFFSARTVLVDGPGNQLFPGAALPADEHGRMGWRDGSGKKLSYRVNVLWKGTPMLA